MNENEHLSDFQCTDKFEIRLDWVAWSNCQKQVQLLKNIEK